jgi:hypothetical protein
MLTTVFTLFSDTVKQEGKHMLVSSIVRNTLGIKRHVVKNVEQEEYTEGIRVLDLIGKHPYT